MLCGGDGEDIAHTHEENRKAKKQIADRMRTNLQERKGAFHLQHGARAMHLYVQGRAKKILLSSVTHVPSRLMGCALAA